ncbi:MAG: tryptophan synthase subunit beta [Candidatus Margulisbacteria bacterium]|nr:tryptophan synthase subunit beta [Candidatus Margulisiibacteriota bacterium]
MKKHYFGKYGGQFVPELLIPALHELESAFEAFKKNKKITDEFKSLLQDYVGRPSPLYFARNLSQQFSQKIYLKREDLNHTGSHKINNTLGQILLARSMGKTRIIAETGAGQHGVATATAAALMNMDCVVYMGEEDMKRQKPNVQRMELLGAEVRGVPYGSRTLKEAVTETFKDWISNLRNTYYLLGSAMGPAPYPEIVRYFQSIIGREAKKQIRLKEKKLPDYVIACVGGGSNAIGIFSAFIKDPAVRLIGVEAGGQGEKMGQHCATLGKGHPGIFQGSFSYLLSTPTGQISPTHSISAGLDYPGVGPEHSFLKDKHRAEYVSVSDKEAEKAFHLLTEKEGIMPALESSHALAYTFKLAEKIKKNSIIVVNLSGRGDKDMGIILGDK